MNRRRLLKLLLAAPLLRCASGEEVAQIGRLTARPAKPTRDGAVGNVEPLGLGGSERDGVVYAAADGDRAARPLLLLLHGATGSGAHLLSRMQSQITTPGVVIAAPDSRGMTWDIVRTSLGPDVVFIDDMLRAIFDRYAVDRARIAVAGFSDGASYALTLGLTNGDLFRHVMAFSPGFLALKKASSERPRVFIAHGREDEILSFEESGKACRRDARARRLRRHLPPVRRRPPREPRGRAPGHGVVELAYAAAACDTALLMTQRAIRFFAFTSDNGAGLSGV